MSVIRHVNQLIAQNDVALVESLYRTLLKRKPDPDGVEFYVGLLRSGYSKAAIIVDIAASPEAQAVGLSLPGLQQFIATQKKHDRSFWRRISRNRQRETQMNCLENSLARILNDLDTLKQEVRQRLEALEDRLQLTANYGVDRNDVAEGEGHLPTEATTQPRDEPGEVDLSGVPLVARRIFRELSATIKAVNKSKIM